jgi:hypothetical protein
MAVDKKKMDEARKKLDQQKKGETTYPAEFDTTKSGAKIIGQIRRRESVPTPKGKQTEGRILEIETESGNFSIWEKTVLTSKLDRLGVQVGDTIAIECLGKPKGKVYYDFNVSRA